MTMACDSTYDTASAKQMLLLSSVTVRAGPGPQEHQGHDMIVLAIVCGVFAGFAARRFLSARDAWDFWRLRRATLPGLRGVFYKDAGRCVVWALGAVVLFFLVVHLV